MDHATYAPTSETRTTGHPVSPPDRALLADILLSSALDCIVVADVHGRIVEFNAAAERIFGYRRDEVIGRTMEDTIIPPHHREAHRKGMARYVAGGAAKVIGRRVELEAQRRDGGIFPVELTITEAKLGSERLFVANLRDISEQKQAAEELHRARASIQAFFDHMPIGIYINRVDPANVEDMTIEFANEAIGKPYGLRIDQVVGSKPYADYGPELKAVVTEIDKQVIGEKRAVQWEMQNPYHGRYELYSRFPIMNAEGEVTHVGGMNLDIDDRVRAETQLKETRAMLEAIFDSVPAELYLRELDGTYVMMNEWGAKQLGGKPEDIVGRNIRDFRLPSQQQPADDMQQQLLETGAPVTREMPIPFADRTVSGLITLFPVKDAEGKIVRVGGIIFDMTELHNTREQLATARESLHQSEKLAALGQLLAGVAHELNNPLAIVLGRSAILIEKLKETPHAASLEKLREAANRCSRIVGTFLALARQTGPRRGPVKINELIDGVIEMTSYALRNANIAVSLDRDPEIPDIEADGDQIIQVLINLIVNAQQALEASNRERRIEVKTRFDAGSACVVIDVVDNGPGVPSEAAARIFEPFFTTKAVGQGTGLGLSLCKSLVEAHGGTLTLHETEGGGATFRATLPVGVLRLTAMAADTIGHSQHAGGGHVLIVDDELEIAAILADCLSPLGITCDVASDGATALEKIARTDFDAIFCDVTMPGMDGITMHSKLKETHPELAERLVFVSGDLLHRNFEQAKALAGRPIIEKPFDPELVRRTALDMLNREGLLP